MRAVEQSGPDLLVLDLALPDGSGTDVARRAARLHPDSRSIILSALASTFVVPSGLRLHIHGVVEMTKAYSALQREVMDFLATRSGLAHHDPKTSLSPREREVFWELCHGLINKQIACRLGISAATVAMHRKRIAAKLKVRGPALVRLASLHHLSGGA